MLDDFKKRYYVTGNNGSTIINLAFTSKKSMDKMLPVLERAYKLKDVTVRTMLLVPENMVDSLAEGFTDLAIENEAKEKQEALKEKKRKAHLRDHSDEYWNTRSQEFRKIPTPSWSLLHKNDGWWRYISPKMYEVDTDYYHELFKDYSYGVAQTIALRAPELLYDHIDENWTLTTYEKKLLEGEVVNINPAGGFNSWEPIEVRTCAQQPVSTKHDGGLTGILTPDGRWYACAYSGHGNLVRWLDRYTDYRVSEAYYNSSHDADCEMFVLFSHGTGLAGTDVSVAYWHGGKLTEESAQWLEEQLTVMSPEQRRYVKRVLKRKDKQFFK